MHDIDRLKTIASHMGGLQIVYAGKAHPHDGGGKVLIEAIFRARDALAGHVPVVYLEDYDLELAKLLTSGVDLWLNTPLPPLEASGTSGMKAALNGVPSLSVLDGWWIEGHVENVTGWRLAIVRLCHRRPARLPMRRRCTKNSNASSCRCSTEIETAISTSCGTRLR
jgi:starch phosphorylase